MRTSDPMRGVPVYGLCVHTTGQSIVRRFHQSGSEDICKDIAQWYLTARYAAHYTIAWDGTIYQIADDDRRLSHVGHSSAWRRRYLSDDWESTVPIKVAEHWRARWPVQKSPAHLYPSTWPNTDYVGVELPPVGYWHRGEYHEMAEPFPDSRYTTAQYVSCGALAQTLAERHGWPDGWLESPRLLGHEDLTPHSRSNGRGGWDPGALRDEPWIDWAMVRIAVHLSRLGISNPRRVGPLG